MKQFTREQLTNIVNEAHQKNSKVYELETSSGDATTDAMQILAGSLAQTQQNCENIIVDVLDAILNDRNS